MVETPGDFLPTAIFFGFLTLIFSIAWRLWGQSFELEKKDRALLSSCCTSLSHGIPATLLAAWQLSQAWPLKVDSQNSYANQLLLQYTLAYMLADTIWYLIPYTPTDFLFCTHHIVVIVYVVSTVRLGKGGITCIFMLLFGECTSLWQNSWYICDLLRRHTKILASYRKFLSTTYPACYILVRSIIGPPSVIWLCLEMYRSKTIPATYTLYKFRNTWIGICLVSLAGSQLWSLNLAKTWLQGEDKSQKLAEKLN